MFVCSYFQAYTVELESLVTQLEEENARLLREEVLFNFEVLFFHNFFIIYTLKR